MIKDAGAVEKKLGRWRFRDAGKQAAFLGDHVPYGLYRRYLPDDARYITILRDPVERALSHYFMAQAAAPRRRSKGKGLPAGFPDGPTLISLREALEQGLPVLVNLQVRFLSGAESISGELEPGALEQAKKHLTRFALVGITERFDESLAALGRLLDADLASYELRHVNEQRPTKISAGTRALVADHNKLDKELYEFARTLAP